MTTSANPISPPPALVHPTLPLQRNGDTAPAARFAVPRRSSRQSRLIRLSVKIIFVAGLFGGAVWGVKHWLGSRNDRPAEITASVTRATLAISVTERGEIESAKTVVARCEIEGHQNKIVEVLPEGTPVKKGQDVVKFDAEQLTRQFAEQEIKSKQADGKFKAAKSKLEQARNKAEGEVTKAKLDLTLADLDREKYPREYAVEVNEKKGAIALAEKDLEEAKEKLRRYAQYVKKGFGTPEQLRLKAADMAKAEYYLVRDREKLSVLEDFTRKKQETELTAKAKDAKLALARTTSSGDAAIAEAQSDLEAAEVTSKLEKAAMERAKKQLHHCVIQAPQDGILVYAKDRPWDPNGRIQAGAMVHYQQNIFSLPDLAQMQVKVKIHESMVKKIKAGQKAEILLEALPNQTLHGTVLEVATLADNRGYWDERGVKEYVTVVRIDDLPSDAGLKPGMTAEVKILVAELPIVLLVPVQAVAQIEGKHYAYVVAENGIDKREVKVGENNEKLVEIKEGLNEGERVALDARARLAAEAKDAPTAPAKEKAAEKSSAVAAPASK